VKIGFRSGAVLALLAVLLMPQPQAGAQSVAIQEVAVAAPDIVHVTLRDPPFSRGRIEKLDRPRAEANGSWVLGKDGWGLVIGKARDHLRLSDTPPASFLDRAAIDDASRYAAIAGRRVTAVHRKSMPYDSGLFRTAGGDTRTGASFRHELYLQLDGALPQGRHVIGWPPGTLPDTRFDYDERSTRASAIRVTQAGHRRADLAKVAYLSLWLPGGPDEGAVDFRRYRLDRFRILDAQGREVHAAGIRLRAAPADPEPGNGLPSPLLEYTSAAAARVPLLRVDRNRFTALTRHGFVAGQRIALERLNGEQDAAATFATVTLATETEFEVAALAGEIPARLSPLSTATPAHRANRAGTFVFELDYSDWRPAKDGSYRLQIPGLGVSDAITIADTVWHASARLSLAGLYHHRSGIALDGRFGYARPQAFRPGAGLSIRASRLPLPWSSEFPGGFIPFEKAALSDWLTEAVMPQDYWGGYMDAGDWDRRIQHVDVAMLMLEAHERAPPAKRGRAFGLPRSSAFLDPALYRDTDHLPELIHEAIWVLDFFRRLQLPDGGVRGGIESAGHPAKGEPSFLEHQTVFAYAPDHLSSYRYAAAAARLARILRELNSPRLGDVFAASALAAWNAAERGFADPDAYYAEAIAAGTRAGAFEATSWQQRRAALQSLATEYRNGAAASLARLTGESGYRAIFEAGWRAKPSLYAHSGDAAWEYRETAGADRMLVAEIDKSFLREAAVVVEAQNRFAYPGMKHPAAPAGWGQGGAPAYPELMLLMRAHRIGGDPDILRTMERAHHAMLGANQLGLSLMMGAGLRSASNPLHEDSLAMGVPAPAGITIFGWASQAQTAHGWVFGPPWSPLPEVGTAEHARERRIEPPRFALPYVEYLVEHPALVMQQEYTVQQSIGTMAALALYLDAQ
jgi:endoglucanase